MSYAVDRAGASHPVVVGPYYGSADGRLRAEVPSSCPRLIDDGEICQVVVNHHRNRKTGPQYPVLVVTCRTHRRSFTVYPPGHVPYSRVPILVVGPDGGEIAREVDERAESEFEGTLFEAALDAATGQQWERAEFGDSGPWWNTQVRHLGVAVDVLGVAPNLAERTRERVATALEVPLFDLRGGAQSIVEAPGYRACGRAVMDVLAQLVGAPRALERLMLGGHRAGRWGLPYFWDSRAACLRSPAFPVLAGRPPPGAR